MLSVIMYPCNQALSLSLLEKLYSHSHEVRSQITVDFKRNENIEKHDFLAFLEKE